MKKFLTAIALTAICLISKAQSKADTIPVKEGYIMVKSNKWGPFHKVKCDYIIKQDSKYYAVGKRNKLVFIKYDSLTAQN